ncbi:LysM peptidoglycan-binding domain-containing protein [Bacillus sp. CGMCC 1.16607]|uniref:cell division suppressor protein YneA n=1 Tax=Bacillus sp. CGMCC 1.16607 TaxID=3351842 RepID=UPI00362821C3
MKQIWTKHTYTILLISISCFTALFLSFKSDLKEEQNMIITINHGDTLWDIAGRYSTVSGLSNKQFVNWMLTHNELDERKLTPGEQVVLPIKNFPSGSTNEIASAIGE